MTRLFLVPGTEQAFRDPLKKRIGGFADAIRFLHRSRSHRIWTVNGENAKEHEKSPGKDAICMKIHAIKKI